MPPCSRPLSRKSENKQNGNESERKNGEGRRKIYRAEIKRARIRNKAIKLLRLIPCKNFGMIFSFKIQEHNRKEFLTHGHVRNHMGNFFDKKRIRS